MNNDAIFQLIRSKREAQMLEDVDRIRNISALLLGIDIYLFLIEQWIDAQGKDPDRISEIEGELFYLILRLLEPSSFRFMYDNPSLPVAADELQRDAALRIINRLHKFNPKLGSFKGFALKDASYCWQDIRKKYLKEIKIQTDTSLDNLEESVSDTYQELETVLKRVDQRIKLCRIAHAIKERKKSDERRIWLLMRQGIFKPQELSMESGLTTSQINNCSKRLLRVVKGVYHVD